MEWLILNVFTVGITTCAIPLACRLLLKRPLGKIAAAALIFVNTLAMVVGWVIARGLILTGDFDRQPTGGSYITYGVGIAALISWAALTVQGEKSNASRR